MQDKDSRVIQNSIAWNGALVSTVSNNKESKNERAMDVEFKEHFETLLNEMEDGLDLIIPDVGTHVPAVDISPAEIDSCIKALKATKSLGVDGLPPRILKCL